MEQPINPFEDYRRLIEQRRQIWFEKYSPAVIEALTEEINVLQGGLEQILRDSGTLPTDYVDNDFYRDSKFKEWVLDESKLPELSEEQKAVVKFVSQQTFTTKVKRRTGQYHHTTKHGSIQKFLFAYWKENDPVKFKKLLGDTIEHAVNGMIDRGTTSDEVRISHFKELKSKDISQISYEDVHTIDSYHQGYRIHLVTMVNEVVHSLLRLGILQITPGYKHYIHSVQRQYLRE